MIDWNKPLMTVSGDKARLLGKIEHPTYPCVVAIIYKDNEGKTEDVERYTESGSYYSNGEAYCRDLKNATEVRVKYANVYTRETDIYSYNTLKDALDSRRGDADGTLKMTYEDGVLVSAEVVKEAV